MFSEITPTAAVLNRLLVGAGVILQRYPRGHIRVTLIRGDDAVLELSRDIPERAVLRGGEFILNPEVPTHIVSALVAHPAFGQTTAGLPVDGKRAPIYTVQIPSQWHVPERDDGLPVEAQIANIAIRMNGGDHGDEIADILSVMMTAPGLKVPGVVPDDRCAMLNLMEAAQRHDGAIVLPLALLMDAVREAASRLTGVAMQGGEPYIILAPKSLAGKHDTGVKLTEGLALAAAVGRGGEA